MAKIRVTDGTNTKELIVKPDGTATWDGKSLLTEASNNPVGTVIAMAANSAPSGYLLCNGSAVSRTTYADLFTKIGTTYGTGDGSTTFNLPNLTDRFIQGSGTAGTVKAAGLPNVTGKFPGFLNSSHCSGPFSDVGDINMNTGSGSTYHRGDVIQMQLSKANSIYGASTTVQPPALTMRMYIKY